MSSIHPIYIYTNESKARNGNNPNPMEINNPNSEKNSYFIITILIEMITILIEMIDNEMINIQERLINGQLVN